MKTYILLCTFFSFGIGEEIPLINELADLKLRMERQLNESVKLRNQYSGQEIKNIIKSAITELPLDSPCSNLDLFDESSQFSHKLNKIIRPLNDWIFQSTRKIVNLNAYIDYLTIFGQYDKYYFKINLNDIFFDDCNSSLIEQKPEKTVNTNDIFSYQSKSYCDSVEEFQCGSGECIGFNRTCDGTFDCWDGSDELGACREMGGCEGCQGFCVPGPRGQRCLAECPSGFKYTMKKCPFSKPCYLMCIRKSRRHEISPKCLVEIFSNLMNNTEESINDLVRATSNRVRDYFIKNKCTSARNNFKDYNNDFTKDDMTTPHTTTSKSTARPTTTPRGYIPFKRLDFYQKDGKLYLDGKEVPFPRL